MIKVSYLVLVDEEKHDRQDLQEENEQEEDEKLWRHKEEREDHLSVKREKATGDNRHLSVKSEQRINRSDGERPRPSVCESVRNKKCKERK